MLVVGVVGCGGDDDGDDEDGRGDGDEARVESLTEWCDVADEQLPALVFTSAEALDDPDRQHELELEAVEIYVDHYENLADPPAEVPADVAARVEDLAATFVEMRDEVADGARLPTVVGEREAGGGDDSLTTRLTALAADVDRVCA